MPEYRRSDDEQPSNPTWKSWTLFLGFRDYIRHSSCHDISNASDNDRENISLARISIRNAARRLWQATAPDRDQSILWCQRARPTFDRCAREVVSGLAFLTLPLLMTAFLSPRMSASSMKCVVRSSTFPRLALCRIRHICRLDTGSTPAVGSSRIIN